MGLEGHTLRRLLLGLRRCLLVCLAGGILLPRPVCVHPRRSRLGGHAIHAIHALAHVYLHMATAC